MQQELETADGQAGVGCNCQVVFARALTYYARRPTLLKQQLVPAITLNDQTLQLHIAIVSGDSKIKGDLLHRSDVGERKPVVESCNNFLRARFQRKSGGQVQFLPVRPSYADGRWQR